MITQKNILFPEQTSIKILALSLGPLNKLNKVRKQIIINDLVYVWDRWRTGDNLCHIGKEIRPVEDNVFTIFLNVNNNDVLFYKVTNLSFNGCNLRYTFDQQRAERKWLNWDNEIRVTISI